MEYSFENIELNNSKAASSRLEKHRQIIQEKAQEGWHFAGWLPTKNGPSGKILEMDLIFEK